MLNLILLLAGFIPLIIGANQLVDGASAIAKKYNIPNIVIGLTIVAFGTSSPELIVNVFASINGNSEIVLGNILGSNIFNILGILGISALIYPLAVKNNTTWIEIPLCILSAIVVFVMMNDIAINNSQIATVNRAEGIILLLFFIIFLVYNIQLVKTGFVSEELEIKKISQSRSIIYIVIGFMLLVVGGRIIVVFATKFAFSIGLSERIIALTIVSIGTSLPELATSVIAAKKKNVDIAIGNIVGSNIFNSFFILGISAVINPVAVTEMSNLDILMSILASLLLFIFIFTGKGRKIERWEGIILFVLYVIYTLYLLISMWIRILNI